MDAAVSKTGFIGGVKRRIGRRHNDLLHINREILLQNLFYRTTDALGLTLPPLYPVGGAANYGLLSLVTRIVSENRITRILDIGAGQTSLLLDALAKQFPIEITTLESDAQWAAHITAKVAHRVVHSPLAQREVSGRSVLGYSDISNLAGPFDLIIIDGPMGTDRFSRWAALEILAGFRAPEFIAIFDDAERDGERDTIDEFMRANSGSKIEGLFLPRALKQQFVAFTPNFAHVRYYGWL